MTTFNRVQLKRYTYFQQEQYQPVLDAEGNPVINPDTGEAEVILSEPAEHYYGNFFPVEVEPTTYTTGLYVVDYNKSVPNKFKLWRADDHWLDLDGIKQMRGGLITAPNKYFNSSNFGVNMNNSDIIGTNAIYFGTIINDQHKGINFLRTDNNYDNIAAIDGELYFTINVPLVTATKTRHKVLTANNYTAFSPKLDGTGATGNWNINALSSKKIDHLITITLTNAAGKTGVTGSIVTDFSGSTINIATELSPFDASKIASGIIDIARLPQGASDRRFKDNIQEIDASRASKIKLCQFYNKRISKNSGGVIAQEIEKIYPDAVYTDNKTEDKYKFVDYNYIFTILHESHRNEIDKLREEIREKSMYDLSKLSIRKLLKMILLKIMKVK